MRSISDRCFIIGEVSQTHDGSLGQAHAFIDAIAATGADAVKFQTHFAEHESSPDEPFRVAFSRQDATRYDYWRRMEFTPEQWAELKRHSEEKGLVFMSSAFSLEAAQLLAGLEVAVWKVGSGELGSEAMLEAMIATGRPIILSTGMSDFSEMDALTAWLTARGADYTLLQCTTKYPCGFDQIGLNVMAEMAERYGCPVGLSDHSASIFPSLAAATLGASALEVHVAFSREMFGPDVAASLTTAELTQMVEGVRAIETMQAHPVDKNAVAEELGPLKTIFGKSAYARRALAAGDALSRGDVAMLKPGGGIAERDLGQWIGKRLARDVAARAKLAPEDFDG